MKTIYWMIGWLSPGWWKYVLGPRDKASRNAEISWPTVVFCRARGHGGYVWFRSTGLEPDYRCNQCYEDLG